MIDLNHLALFVAVVDGGSFAAASRQVGSPPNTVSRQIQQLERQVGARLLHRSTRKLTLTDAGEALYANCRGAIAEIAQAGEEAVAGSRRPAGLVRVAAPVGFLDAVNVAWVGEFLAAHPDVRLQFVLNDARADLVGERIDVAFRATSMVDDASVGRPLLVNDFGLVASPAYVAARGMPTNLEALAAHDCLTPSAEGGRRRTIWRFDGPHGAEAVVVDGRLSANTASALLESALAGLGIALLPTLVVVPWLRGGRLVRVLPALRRRGGGLHLVVPTSRQIPRAVAVFAEFASERLRRAFAERPSEGGDALPGRTAEDAVASAPRRRRKRG